MWKVFFNEVVVFSSKTDVEALQFALSLHQASNVEHEITVHRPPKNDDNISVCICQLNKA